MALPAAAMQGLRWLITNRGGGGGGGGEDDSAAGNRNFEQFAGRIRDVNSGLDRLSFNLKSLNIPLNVVQGGRDLAFTFDKLNIALGQTTGFTEHLTKGMLDLTAESYELGLSFEEAQKITAELALNFRKFPALSESVRLSLSKVAAQLHQVGVNSRDSSRSIDIFVSALGKTPEAAADSMQSIHLLAQEVGLSTSTMVQEFNNFAPKLLKYGDSYENLFSRLQKSARAYRLDASEALNITDQFDTFEGAAQKVGALNAVFGRYGLMLNDAELREMDEAERLEHIGEQFRNVGLSVEDLSRRQRQFLAQQLTGGNQDMLFRFLGGQPREQLQGYQQQQQTVEESAMKMTDSLQRLQGATQKFFIDSGLMNKGVEDMNNLAASMQNVAKQGATIVDFYSGYGAMLYKFKKEALLTGVDVLGSLAGFPAYTTDPAQRADFTGRLDASKVKPVPDIFIPATSAEMAGTNFITGPAGTFKLRSDDSIIAGTDLGGGGISPKELEMAVAKGMQSALKMMKSPSSGKNVQVVLNNRIVGEVIDGIEKQYGLLSPS